MKKVLAVAIIAFLLISTFAAFTQATNSQPSATPNLSVQPSLVHAVSGVPFSVDVVVNGVTPDQRVTGIQFRVQYDPTILQVTHVTEGQFMQDPRWNLHSTLFIQSVEVDPIYGPTVLVGDLLLPDSNGVWAAFPNGTGTVAKITFTTILRPEDMPKTTPLTIVNNLIINDNAPPIDSAVPSTVTNGIVQIAGPWLSVQPSSVHAVLGVPFSVDVVVNGVTPDQRVTGIQFRVQYDPTILQVTGVTEGQFMQDPRWDLHSTFFIQSVEVDPIYGPTVLVGDLLLPDSNGVWAAFPNGTGTVATITFTAIAHPTSMLKTTPLTIVNNLIINDNAPPIDNEVPSSVSNGAIQIELPPQATLTVYPALSYALVGHPFTVGVLISGLSSAWRTIGIQFRLCYDPTIFEVVNVTEGPFMRDPRWDLHGTYFTYSVEVDPIYGPSILIGDLLLPDSNGNWSAFPSGFGTLATITLNPIRAAGLNDSPLMSTLSIKDDLIVNDDIGDVAHTVSDGQVTILPTQPTLSVEPQLIEAHATGTIFSVNVDVSELNAGWRVIGIQFRLPYDPTLLQVVNVTEGPFMRDPRWDLHGTFLTWSVEVDPVYGSSVLFGDLLLPDDNGNWTAFPTGNGTVATITFMVVGQGRGLGNPPLAVQLNLVQALVVNDNLDAIPLNLLSGEFRVYPTHIADINLDGKVDMKDIGLVAKAFGSYPGHPRWNAACDVVIDNIINMRDVGVVARNFGWISS